MANLTAKTAFDGTLPLTHGDVTLTEVDYDAVTWIAPHKGKQAATSKGLEKQIGAGWPEANRTTGSDGKRAVWTGPNQALVLGPVLKDIKGAAMIDHSSAWAAAALEGPSARDVLARLVPVDLRDDRFAMGHGARTLLGHMNCVLMRTGRERFEVLVFRSMAQTCAHELARAMRMVAARHA